jgi:hypothetical protein
MDLNKNDSDLYLLFKTMLDQNIGTDEVLHKNIRDYDKELNKGFKITNVGPDILQLLKDLTQGNELNNNTLISLPPPPDIGILMMDHAINRVEIKNELRRIKKRSLGLPKPKIQTKRRKLVNKVNPELKVIGESISQ